MEEVTNPFGLSDRSQHDPSMLAAAWEGADIKGKDVVDVNGQKLGRVASAFAEDGALARFDVHLTDQARRLFIDTREVVGVPADAIASVDEQAVKLRQAGEALLHPEDARSLHSSRDERGAPDLPRKVR